MNEARKESDRDGSRRMRHYSLQQKAWMITAGVLLALGALLALGVDGVFRRASSRLEQQWVAECVRRVKAMEEDHLEALERSARDYAAWTDTYEFVEGGAANYVQNNLSAAMFENLGLDAFLIFDREGRVHTARSFVGGEVSEAGIAELGAVLAPHAREAGASEEASVKGLLRVGGKVVLFAALPILRDDTSGPSRGAVVQVRFLDDERVAEFRRGLNLAVSLDAPDEGVVAASEEVVQVPRGDRELLVRVPLRGLDGGLAGVWRLTLPREIHQQGERARLIFYIVICVLIAAATWVIGRLLRSMVIARLEALHRVVQRVGDTTDLSPRVPVKGSDELAELTTGVNRMFDALARSEEQRKAAEAEQERLNGQLQQAQKMEAIGTLTGGLAHDFNNLLTSIQGSAALIRLSGTANPECERHLARIDQAAAHGAALVRQMMAFGRRSPTVFAPVRLDGLVRGTLQLLRPSFPRGIEVEFENEAEGAVVRADAAQLQQVLINLGTNSCHAMASGRGKFAVRLAVVRLPDPRHAETSVMLPGEYLRLEVSDTGAGIAAQHLPRIFEPFFTTKPVGSGTGLGLAVVHGIVAHHRGAIGVESAPGVGTTFFIHLPKATAAEEPAPAEASTRDERDDGKTTRRVLLVDDDQMVRDTLSAGLKRLGYGVVPVSGGPEALDVLRSGREEVDLVVTDQMMPGMTGVELGQKIVAEQHRLPLVLITGYASALNETAVRAMGFSAMLMKPVTMDALDRTLRSVVRAE